MAETKKCNYCGEEIKKDAIKCRYCGEWVDKEKQEKMVEKQKQKKHGKVLRNSFFLALAVSAVINLWEFLFGVKFSTGSGNISHFITTAIVLTIIFFIIGMWGIVFDKLSS